jgi:chemotaxis protein histidine kinase CheA
LEIRRDMPSDLLEDFVFDSREHLTNASNQLLSLEKNPGSLDNLNALMGTLHTIKGNSGFVNQRHLYELLHSAESLLQTVRDNKERGCPSEVVEVLFQVWDTSEALMTRLEHDEDDEVDWLPNLLDAIKESAASLEWAQANENNPAKVQAETQAETQADQAEDEVVAAAPEESREEEPEYSSEDSSEAQPEYSSEAPKGSETDEEVPTLFDPALTIQYVKVEDGDLNEKGENYLLDSMIVAYKGSGEEGLILDLSDLTYLGRQDARYIEQLTSIWRDRMAIVLSRKEQEDLVRIFIVLDLYGSMSFYPGKEEAKSALEAKG